MAVGLVLLAQFGKPFEVEINAGEWIAGTCLLSGLLAFTAGVTVWLWRVMP